VVGDKLYASTKPDRLGFKRLALHAREITFKDTKGETQTIIAPFPPDFIKAMKEIDFNFKIH